MTAAALVDTNVLVYAASNAAEDQAKRAVARQVLAQPDICFSAQVLQEFYVVAVAKQRLGMTHDEAMNVLHSLSAFTIVSVTSDLVLEAANERQRFGISYWDAAILVAAKRLGCAIVYSEDLSASQDYDGVRVVNPFVAGASVSA
jgi:predicted nucleic acid-binding protein